MAASQQQVEEGDESSTTSLGTRLASPHKTNVNQNGDSSSVLQQGNVILNGEGICSFNSEQYTSKEEAPQPLGPTPTQSNEESFAQDSRGNEHIDERKKSGKSVGPQDFELLSVIGRGAFGKVLQVRHRRSGKIYAMKVLHKRHLADKGQVSYTHVERQIMASVDHPYLVSLKFAFQTHERLYLVMEYCAGGELFWHLNKQGMMLEDAVRVYSAELVLAIEHLHKQGIVHRDLKPENILLKENGHVAVTDYGMAKMLSEEDDTTKTICGTTEYMAPEMVARSVMKEEQNANETSADSNSPQQKTSENSTGYNMGRSFNSGSGPRGGYGKAVDWWSLGALIYEMLTGKPPFQAHNSQKNPMKLYRKILSQKPPLPKYLSGNAHSLLKGLLTKNPDQRLGCTRNTMFKIGGVTALKRHPFFEGIDWDSLEEEKIRPPIEISSTLQSVEDTHHFDEEFTKERPCVLEAELQDEQKTSTAQEVNTCPSCDETCDSVRLWRGFSFAADDEDDFGFYLDEGMESQNGRNLSTADEAEQQWISGLRAKELHQEQLEQSQREEEKAAGKLAKKQRKKKKEADYPREHAFKTSNWNSSEENAVENVNQANNQSMDQTTEENNVENASGKEVGSTDGFIATRKIDEGENGSSVLNQSVENISAASIDQDPLKRLKNRTIQEKQEHEDENRMNNKHSSEGIISTNDFGVSRASTAQVHEDENQISNNNSSKSFSTCSAGVSGASTVPVHERSDGHSRTNLDPNANEWIPLSFRRSHGGKKPKEPEEDTHAYTAPVYPHSRWRQGIEPQSSGEQRSAKHLGGKIDSSGHFGWRSQRVDPSGIPKGTWARALAEGGTGSYLPSDTPSTEETARTRWTNAAQGNNSQDASQSENNWLAEALEQSKNSKKKKKGKKKGSVMFTFGAPRMR